MIYFLVKEYKNKTNLFCVVIRKLDMIILIKITYIFGTVSIIKHQKYSDQKPFKNICSQGLLQMETEQSGELEMTSLGLKRGKTKAWEKETIAGIYNRQNNSKAMFLIWRVPTDFWVAKSGSPNCILFAFVGRQLTKVEDHWF